MQEVIVMCGYPRSGKTTYAKTYLSDYVRVSMDDIISMMSQTFQLKLGDFYKKAEGMLIKEIIKKKYNLVIDRTSLTKKTRRKTLNRIILSADEANISKPFIKLIVIETPINICINRNVETQKVPPGILHMMIKGYEEPALDEGWDEIIRIKG